MSNLLSELQPFLWLIIPLGMIQLILLIIGIRDWNLKKASLGDNKLPWLLIIIFINFIGPLVYLYYSHNTLQNGSPKNDDWEIEE